MILSTLFFVTALCYASVGFGGGSSYIALLVLWDVSYAVIPVLALVCNIVVVSGNSVNYIRSKQVNTGLLIPHLIGSVPAAYIGGLLPVIKRFLNG